MNKHNSNKQPPVFSMKNKLWLVTFGDLLTLLLTFFVMTIALSGQNEAAQAAQNQVNPNDINGIEENIKEEPLIRLSGTNIAIYKRRTPVREVGLSESDFNTEADELKSEAVKKLKMIISSRKDELSSIRLELCGGSGGYATEVSWFKSISRALFIRSQ